MDIDKIIMNKLERQDRFILDLFNDKRISNKVKLEWMQKYNELQIKVNEK